MAQSLLLLWSLLHTVVVFLVSEDKFIGVPQPAEKSGAQYCGIYAVYGAARALKNPVDFTTLVSQDFVSSPLGSTESDLVRCISSIGLNSTHYRGLGEAALYASKEPLILHVSSHGQLDVYDHWMLFLGVNESGDCRIVDSNGAIVNRPLAEVLARWDGVGLCVHSRPYPASPLARVEARSALWMILVAVSLVLIIRELNINSPLVAGCNSKAVLSLLFVLAIVVAAGTINLLRLSCTPVLEFLAIEAGARDLALVSRSELVELTNENNRAIRLVDSRFEADYSHGSIAGAINLPIDSTYKEIEARTKSWPRDSQIIVFCQSESCPFSDYVARRLVLNGFAKVSIYRGGWIEWVQGL